ncbi:aKG-HExxH-type peptide beta-hydroxylase [Nocardia sp. NPDC051570]|uniref:aKG-HExxH-type peptide beta-hydroxylase n=1 Tax=Nocardia sp. NPDC051570 TaxID=3364324 RepID=UPI003794D0BA
MRVLPDAESAAVDQLVLIRLVRSLLEQVVTGRTSQQAIHRALNVGAGCGEPSWCYPGLVAAAQWIQRSRNDVDNCCATSGFDTELSTVLDRAESSNRRTHPPLAAFWQVDLAPPEPHLVDSVHRALAQIPRRAGIEPQATVVDWPQRHRELAHTAAELIHRVWPEMFAEMATVVRQLALLAGPSINGFTDFTTHGAVYLNRTRFDVGSDSLPAHCRVAEALVHEATHNRCNIACLRTHFLTADVQRVSTPLRADPRPLSGLFQQIVVITRCVRLYDLILERGAEEHASVRVRRDRLLAKGLRAVGTGRAHATALSDAGIAVIDEAGSILRAAESIREPIS